MSQELYEKILDTLFDGVYFVDTQKKITFWSKGAERITGYKKVEVMGKCCSDNILRHVDKNGRELCVTGCPLMATLQDSAIRDSKVYLHHKKGHRVPVSVRVTPIFDSENKKIVGAVEIFQDISKRDDIIKELEQLRHEILLEVGGDIPLFTRIIIGASNFLVDYGVFIILLLVGALFFSWRYSRTERGAYTFAQIQLEIPAIGGLYRKLYLSRIADNLSTMLESGIPMVRALEITASVVGNVVYEKHLTNAIAEVKG